MLKYLIILSFYVLSCAVPNSQVETKNNSLSYLALGDSYTIGESVAVDKRWPAQLVDSLKARNIDITDFKIIAKTGWRTDDLSNAIAADSLNSEYGLVSLLIGVNNQYQGKSVEAYKPEFKSLLEKAISLAGGEVSKVFVVSIPDYAFTPFGQTKDALKITEELNAYNEACKSITLSMNVKHIDITGISMEGLEKEDLVAEDGLHPSGEQYTLWVDEILKAKF